MWAIKSIFHSLSGVSTGFHGFAISCVFLSLFTLSAQAKATEKYTLENGMEVILKEVHSAPMISSMVFVRSGSKYETRFENGLTHFLEHLLFDGTVSQTQDELDASIRDLGGYINAFTRKELTAYLVNLPSQYIEFGMTVQADMLFNSLIPESQLPKERSVVIEEIKRDADSPGSAAHAFFLEKAYGSTPYDRPVLGYQSFIENIPRAAIVDYWQKYYTPQNMVLLVIGDFETAAMKEKVQKVFGSFKNPKNSAKRGAQTDELAVDKGHSYLAPGTKSRYDTTATVKSTYIDFSIHAPHHSDSLYLPMDLLSQYLSMDEISPLKVALKSGAEPLATEVSVSLIPYAEFSRFEVSVVTDDASKRDSIVATVLTQLTQMASHVPEVKTIEGLKVSSLCQDVYNSAKLHYYGFLIAPYLMTAGWDFIQQYGEAFASVSWEQSQQVAQNYLADPDYVVTVVRPADDSTATIYQPVVISATDVIAHFDTTKFEEYDLTTGHEITFPTTDSISFALEDKSDYYEEQLPNGLTLIVKSTPGQDVFAMNVLGKNRTLSEPVGKEGITDFVNRVLEKGTTTRSARLLADDLAAIGANITLFDNPWIPYDDHYTTRRYSFMKFETIDQYAKEGFELFSDILLHPSFDSVEVENIRQNMLSVLVRRSQAPRDVARAKFYESLFAGSTFGRPVMGDQESVGSITRSELRDYHKKFYSPENMIIAIVSSRPIDEVREWVKAVFGSMTASGIKAGQSPAYKTTSGQIKNHVELPKEQINLYVGGLLPGATDKDVSALRVATSILSERLYKTIRERDGLAYSVGAGLQFDREVGWYYCVMGTGTENYQKAVDGIRLEIDKLRLDGPTLTELRRAKNSYWGRLMRSKLSAVNQAYYLCVEAYLGFETKYDAVLLQHLASVSAADVRRVASQYFPVDGAVLATAGRMLKKPDPDKVDE